MRTEVRVASACLTMAICVEVDACHGWVGHCCTWMGGTLLYMDGWDIAVHGWVGHCCTWMGGTLLYMDGWDIAVLGWFAVLVTAPVSHLGHGNTD